MDILCTIIAVCQLAGRDCIVEVHPFTDCGTTNDNGEYVPGKGEYKRCVINIGIGPKWLT